MNLSQAQRRLSAGQSLSQEQSFSLFQSILAGDFDPSALASFLRALSRRGETVEEITGAARALQDSMIPFEHQELAAIDTCGTGGDGRSSFNISTAAALVAASAGAKVIKHGNRSVSSRCGSADLLEAAGLALELRPQQAQQLFERCGLVFLYAPAYHPGMRAVAAVRRELGIRTIFNLIGPLCNPGKVRRHLLGVAQPAQVTQYAAVLRSLDFDCAYVVHGAGGTDELSLAGDNQLATVGVAPPFPLNAKSLGLREAPVQAIEGGEPQENLALLNTLLAGQEGALRDAVLLNASAALLLARIAESPHEALDLARKAIDSGAAQETLRHWVQLSQQLAGESRS